MYFDPASEQAELEKVAEEKKQQFFARYRRYCKALPARFHLPFALPMRYERELQLRFEDVSFARMLSPAYRRALERSELCEDYFFVLVALDPASGRRQEFLLNANPAAPRFEVSPAELPLPRPVMYLDYRHLFGLLSGLYHWNNAEIGSQFRTVRTPRAKYVPEAQAFLNFLHLC